MKTSFGLLAFLLLTTAAQAQPDSADIFFRHLDLNEVVVTTPTGQMKRKQSATPISIVTAKTLRQAASSNIIDAIARQPGISQVSTGPGISKPVIRGLGYNRVVVVADGVRQEGQQWGDEHGVELDGKAVGQVEILKGPASLIYGSDAMAGVVIFQPEAIEPEGQTAASLATEYQTNSGLIDYSVRLGGNQRGLVWNARYSGKFAHAYHNKYDGYVPGSQFREHAANVLLGINRSWGFSHLTASYYHLTPGLVEGERDSLTGDLIASSSNPKTYHITLPFQQIHHYKAVLDNSFTIADGMLKAIIGYQNNRRQEYEEEHEEIPSQVPTDTDSEESEDCSPSLDFQLHTLTYDARYVTKEFAGWRLTGGLGGMWQRSRNLGEESLIPDYHLFDIGLYATASKQLPRWTFSGGLRFDSRNVNATLLPSTDTPTDKNSTHHFAALSGSLGAVFHVTPKLNLRANIARGFRAPNLSELHSDGVHEGTLRYELGNPELDPEHSWQADLGIDYSSQFISFETSLFINRIDNYIYAQRLIIPTASATTSTIANSIPTTRFPLYQYTQGDALLKGFEAGIDFHPIHQLHIASTFSLVDARQLHQPSYTRWLPRTPAPRFTGEVKWELTHNGDHHSAQPHHLGETRKHHRLDHIFDNAFVSISIDHHCRQSHYYQGSADPAEATETATPAYTLLNASIGTDILLRGKRKLCEIYVIGENLLNTAYQDHLSRLKYADENPVTHRRGIYNPGRNITIKLLFPFTWRK